MSIGSSLIRLGAEFRSYAEFEHIFNLWRTEDHHPMRIASSEMLKEVPEEIQERFRYRYVTFNCMHFGVPRLRGSGKRSNQAYLPCGCKARVRLSYYPEEGKLRISKFVDEHTGHTIISNEGSARTRGRYLVALKQFIPFSMTSTNGSGRISPTGRTPVFDISVQEKYVQQLQDRQKKNYRILAQRRAAKGLPVLDNEFPPIVHETVPVFQKLSDSEVMSPDLHKELTLITYKLLRKKLLHVALQGEVDLLSVLKAQQSNQNPPSNQIATALRAIPPQLPNPSAPLSNPPLDSILTLPPAIIATLLRNPPYIPRSLPQLSSHPTVATATTVTPSVMPPYLLNSQVVSAPAPIPSQAFVPPKSFQRKPIQFGTEVPNGYPYLLPS